MPIVGPVSGTYLQSETFIECDDAGVGGDLGVSGSITLGGALSLGSDADGDVYYRNSGALVRLAKGDDDDVLTLASGIPSWAAGGGGGSARSVAGDTDNAVMTWVTSDNTFAAEANLTYDGTDLSAASSTTNKPVLTLTNTHNGATGGFLKFVNDKGAAGADNDVCGTISFYGDDDNQDNIEFARVQGIVADATNGQEGGKLTLSVAEHDGTVTAGLTLADGDADGEIDVGIGAGVASVTTIAGVLSLGDRNITNVGDIALDSLSADGTHISVAISDDLADSFSINQSSNTLFGISTTNNEEVIEFGSATSRTRITGSVVIGVGTDIEGAGIDRKGAVSVNPSGLTVQTKMGASGTCSGMIQGGFSGDVITLVTNTTDTTASLCYHLTGAQNVALPDPDAEGAGNREMLMLAVDSQLAGGTFLMRGYYNMPVASINFPSDDDAFPYGHPLYLDPTGGAADGKLSVETPTTSGNVVRIVGYVIDGDGTNVLIYFNPDPTWITLA